uniref:hypothetical protein n=1 Tax=Paractinoplanes polyasparticus TaxID=2856853 RepID=UPI001C84A36A|nr:hypothetical protein [Actinoplanes polyasparticus]
MDVLSRPAGPPLTVLTGPAGVGLTHALGDLRGALTRAGRPVLQIRLAPEDRDEDWYLVGRLLSGLARQPARPIAGTGSRLPTEPTGETLARVLRDEPDLVVLIDDAQCADPRSVAALLAALPGLTGTSVRCVATWRAGAELGTPTAGEAALAMQADLIRFAWVRPLTAAATRELAGKILQANPHESLAVPLSRLARGRPAAVHAVLESYGRSGTLRVTDRNAFLSDPDALPRIPEDHALLRPITRLTRDVRLVACALAALAPLGQAAPALIADSLGMAGVRVYAALRELRRGGVAVLSASGWQVAVPAVAIALRDALGPYRRARLAQVAVEAIWSGHAHCADPEYLPDQVAAAGTLVDVPAAIMLLREHASGAAVTAPAAAARWWAAAAAMSGEPADRVEALLSQAGVDLRTGRYSQAGTAVRALLDGYPGDLSPAARAEARMIAAACAASPSSVVVEQIVPDRGSEAGDSRRAATAVIDRLGRTLVLGDLIGAERDLAASDLPASAIPAPERCVRDWRAGRWEAALEAAMFSTAADLLRGRPALGSVVHRAAAEILLARGRPARARTVLAAIGPGHVGPILPVVPAAELDWMLGDVTGASRTVDKALAQATQGAAEPGLDELWLIRAELARNRGDLPGAWAAAGRAAAVAAELGTELAALHAATARMVAAGESDDEVLVRARALNQPYVLARTLERMVRWTGHEPGSLAEAYELLGDLGALLHRSRVRQAMREHALTMPGRSRTLAESELLLATLVADGLSNRELALATQSSEKSVEGRLTRLFTRAGYRSRVELAAAVLAGAFPTG